MRLSSIHQHMAALRPTVSYPSSTSYAIEMAESPVHMLIDIMDAEMNALLRSSEGMFSH